MARFRGAFNARQEKVMARLFLTRHPGFQGGL